MQTNVFSFCVEGPPVPWKRAIPYALGRAIKDERTRAYQRLIATVASLRVPPGWRKDGGFAVDVLVFLKSTRRGDKDNYEKNVLDALKGIAYVDDRQVDDGRTQKILDKARPRVEVTVRRVG